MSNSSIEWVPGEVVTIYNQTLSGEVIVEGEAKLVRELNTHGAPLNENLVDLPGYELRRWLVQFDGTLDDERCERIVHTPEQVEQWRRVLADAQGASL